MKMCSFLGKTSAKMVVYSVQRMVCKRNLVKSASSIHRSLNRVSMDKQSVLLCKGSAQCLKFNSSALSMKRSIKSVDKWLVCVSVRVVQKACLLRYGHRSAEVYTHLNCTRIRLKV